MILHAATQGVLKDHTAKHDQTTHNEIQIDLDPPAISNDDPDEMRWHRKTVKTPVAEKKATMLGRAALVALTEGDLIKHIAHAGERMTIKGALWNTMHDL